MYGEETPRQQFLRLLDNFIRQTEQMPSFRGKTHALRALKRINQLSALR